MKRGRAMEAAYAVLMVDGFATAKLGASAVSSRRTSGKKDAGLVVERQEGTRRIYRVDARGLLPLREYLDAFWGDVLTAFKTEAESKEETAAWRQVRKSGGAGGWENLGEEALRTREGYVNGWVAVWELYTKAAVAR